MDAMLRTICGLLESSDPMRRHAAAIVLAELAPKEAAVVEALGKALTDANSVLVGNILDAFVAMGSPAAAIPYVMPLLDADAMDIKLRAVAMVARAGERVVPEISRRLASAKPGERLLLVDLLARIHAKSAFDVLLPLLFDPDFEFVKAVCEAVRRHMADVPARARTAWHTQLTEFMTQPRVKGQERVMTSCLLLLGAIGEPAARATLLAHATPDYSLYVRRHALIGLKNIELEGAAVAAAARQLIPYLSEQDDALVRHVLDILARVPPGKLDAAALLDSPDAVVRRFAVRQLTTEDTAVANRQLLALLGDPDTDTREAAASALAGHKGATKLLADALLAEEEAEAAWRLAKILKPHSEAIEARVSKRLVGLAEEELRGGRPRAEALLYALRNVDAAAADGVALEVGLAHKKAKRWPAAVDCLRRLINSERFDAETRYALCVCNLKASPKDMTSHARVEDHALRGLQALVRIPALKLADRLQKDKTLDAADRFYVGFHFAESTGDEKALGVTLLQHLFKTAPKSAEGKAAKNKLKLVQTG